MAAIVQLASGMVKAMEEFMKLKLREPVQLDKWIKICCANIRQLNAALKNGENVGVKTALQSAVAKMLGYRTLLKAFRGGGQALQRPNTASWTRNRVRWEDMHNIFQGRMRTAVCINLNHKEPSQFFKDSSKLFVSRIKNILKKEQFLKVNSVFCGRFIKPAVDEILEEFKYFNTKNKAINRDTNILQWFDDNVKDVILKDLEEFQERDSGWALASIVNLQFNINKYTPRLGSSYIDLPPHIKLKRACINLKNNDDACFAWAIISALHPVDVSADRISSYPHYNTRLNFTGISFPISRPDIKRFEILNNISVNVYILNKTKSGFNTTPTRLTSNKQAQHVNLLLIQDDYVIEDEYDDEIAEATKYHYVWIKDLSRLVSRSINKETHKKYFCDRCLHYFYAQDKLGKHIEDCMEVNSYKVNFPYDGKIKFTNHTYKEKCPFVIYADFESILIPVKDDSSKTTQKLNRHEAHSVGYYFHCSYDETLSYYRSYRGLNCAEWFAAELKQIAEDTKTVFLCPIPMDSLTNQQALEFQDTTHCHICEDVFKQNDKRVRDHSHLTGHYRGPAHEECNINYQDSRTIPVVFHNLSGYDSHLLIRDISTKISGNTKIIPNNTEKYIAIIKSNYDCEIKYRFIDSFRFMASSLDKLASYLSEFPIVKKEFPNLIDDQLQLLTRKGVFPYEYISGWANLDEPKLPPKKLFYSKLSDSDISDSDYEHAQRIWNKFSIKTIGEYSDLYLKTDVLLLAEVFENFRQTSLKNYGLDAAHYYTAPGLSWSAMLKYTKVELDYINDVDILMFLEKGVRGGLTQCSKRHSKANNKYTADYDKNKDNNFLLYLDINAMYAKAMSEFLPSGDLKWVKNTDNFNLNVPDNNPIGYILEVDLEVPNAIHDKQRDLPMAPESRAPPGSKQKKLMATLFNKEKYIVHYRSLKQYISEGLVITKIHRVLEFKQSAWLKPYIDLNTRLRTESKNEFEKNLFKLMSNAVFGKTMENIRNHRDIKLITKWEGRYGAEAMIAKPNFHNSTIIENDLVLVELLKTEALFNKPIYVGMALLDISKLSIYEFHYKFIQNKYGDKAKLCYTDTDSLIYEINTKDVYKDIKENISRFDTSEFAANNIYGMPLANKKVPGLMKDENNGALMTEFVGLRAKLYACRVDGKKETKKAKGIKAYVVKNKISFDDYLQCLFGNVETTHAQNSIRSKNHIMHTIRQTKISLSPHDDKRYLIPNSHETLPWGHFSIMNVN